MIEETRKIFKDIPAMTDEEQWEMRKFLAIDHEDNKCHRFDWACLWVAAMNTTEGLMEFERS